MQVQVTTLDPPNDTKCFFIRTRYVVESHEDSLEVLRYVLEVHPNSDVRPNPGFIDVIEMKPKLNVALLECIQKRK